MNEWRKARHRGARPPPGAELGFTASPPTSRTCCSEVGVQRNLQQNRGGLIPTPLSRSLVHLIAHGSLGNPENELMVAAGCPGAAATEISRRYPENEML